MRNALMLAAALALAAGEAAASAPTRWRGRHRAHVSAARKTWPTTAACGNPSNHPRQSRGISSRPLKGALSLLPKQKRHFFAKVFRSDNERTATRYALVKSLAQWFSVGLILGTNDPGYNPPVLDRRRTPMPRPALALHLSSPRPHRSRDRLRQAGIGSGRATDADVARLISDLNHVAIAENRIKSAGQRQLMIERQRELLGEQSSILSGAAPGEAKGVVAKRTSSTHWETLPAIPPLPATSRRTIVSHHGVGTPEAACLAWRVTSSRFRRACHQSLALSNVAVWKKLR